MIKQSISSNAKLEYPDGFCPMDDNELCRYNAHMCNRWGVKSDDGKTIISIGWTDPVNAFISVIVNTRSLLNGFCKYARKNYKGFEQGNSVSKEVCGCEAKGFTFSLQRSRDGAPLHGEIIAAAIDGRYYIFKYITASDDRFFCSQAFNMVLSTLDIKE